MQCVMRRVAAARARAAVHAATDEAARDQTRSLLRVRHAMADGPHHVGTATGRAPTTLSPAGAAARLDLRVLTARGI